MTADPPAVPLSSFATGLKAETAFDVLAVARKLEAGGKDVIELQIGDSPFPSPSGAVAAGLKAIQEGQTHYCASPGLPAFREGIARNYTREFGVAVGPENVVVGPGAKVFEQFFCEAFVNPGDAVLVFTPHFPTYGPNIERRGGRVVTSTLRPDNAFRPNLQDVQRFLGEPRARAIFINFPHNPTGGVATEEDLRGLADLIRARPIALFSDEPYCHMVWQGTHATPLAQPGMLEHTLAAYTFSKSYSMSGWRVGYAITSPRVADAVGKMINTSLSCTPPIAQLAGLAALEHDTQERQEVMLQFRRKVQLLVEHLQKVEGVKVDMPAGTFYAFADVAALCQRLGLTSHGLAMFLLEGADDHKGVACLGGECFGVAGQGFLRFSCAVPDERLVEAVHFLAEASTRIDRAQRYRESHPEYQRQASPS
jgi:aspartate aminotransferase